jgi:hypothetical protein
LHGKYGNPHHDVAIPVEQLDFVNGKLVLAGATKDAIKAMPAFPYAKMTPTPKPRAEYAHH